MDEIIKEFLTESQEGIDQLDNKFVALEQNPEDRETLASIFRTVHTIKGTCGFLGFSRLEKLTHAGENLLSLLRDGRLHFNQDMASALLNMLDAVRIMLSAVEQTETDGDQDYMDLINTLNRLKEGSPAPSPAPALASVTAPPPKPVAPPQPAPTPPPESSPPEAPADELLPPGSVFLLQPPPADEPQAPADELLPPGSVFLLQPPPATEPPVPPKKPEPTAAPPEPAAKPAPERPAAAPAGASAALAETSIRVDVPLLDKLMNLVGELVLARNQIIEYTLAQENPQLIAASQRLNLITSELQEGIMRTRMQPISNIWSKIPRVVRDLSLSCGKQIRVEMEGKETELDKSLIEAMKDPLTHLIRNAVDHG